MKGLRNLVNKILEYSELVSPFNQAKILFHKEKFTELDKNHIVSPVCCELDLTDGFCNNKCTHCFFGTNNKEDPILMDIETAKRIISELANIGVKAVEFSGGGEPTTHPNIVEIIKYSKDMGLDVGIVTNGLLLDKIISVVDCLTFIRVSLDAASKETYKKIHGVDTFEKVIQNIRNIVKVNSGIKIGIGYLIVENNINDILDAVLLSKEIGCRFIQYRPASLEYSISNDVWEKASIFVSEAKRYSSENFQVFDAGVKWKHLNGSRNYEKCTTSSLVAVIKANGDVPLCVLKRNDPNAIIGNISNKSFSEVYFSDKHRKMIDNIDINKCRKPCKHDAYNIVHEAQKDDLYHCNFI